MPPGRKAMMRFLRSAAITTACVLIPFLLSAGTLRADAASGDPEPVPPSARALAATDAALEKLGPVVKRSSHRDALRTAFLAYFGHREAHPGELRNPYLYYVDFGLDNRTRRGWVFDMDALTVVEGPFTVAHGSGSGPRYGVPSSFSNRPGSKMSSLGLYVTQETYGFRGRINGRPYTSIGLRMRGESGSYNSAARRRGIVAHGAPYVTARDAGRSSGCPAMEQDRARRLLPKIANGGVVFIYSPQAHDRLADGAWGRSRGG